MLDTIKNDFYKIAVDSHGTRALQILLEECIKRSKVTKRTKKILEEAFEKSNKTIEMMTNVRGNHVVKQTMKLLNSAQRQKHVYAVVLKNFSYLALDRHGYQVVQECIVMANSEQQKNFIEAVYAQLEVLINSEFGNFIV